MAKNQIPPSTPPAEAAPAEAAVGVAKAEEKPGPQFRNLNNEECDFILERWMMWFERAVPPVEFHHRFQQELHYQIPVHLRDQARDLVRVFMHTNLKD